MSERVDNLSQKSLLICSALAYLPAFVEVARRLALHHVWRVTVVGPERVCVPPAYEPTGIVTAPPPQTLPVTVRAVPLKDPRDCWQGFSEKDLDEAIAESHPDVLWLHDEPNHPTTLHVLRRYYFSRRPRILCSVMENRWRRPPRLQRVLLQLLSRRLDALLPVASLSLQSVRRAYLRRALPSPLVFWPVLDPESTGPSSFRLPRGKEEFWVGFAGRLCHEKGWRVLLGALTRVPPAVKVAIAGAGPDVSDLLLWANTAPFVDRVHYFGSLQKPDLYAMYKQLDALAVPSLTTPRWSEQFGAVLTEAMGHGVPVVASASGAIPEVLAGCGRTVPEGDPLALAEVLNDWVRDPADRKAAASVGRARYLELFSLAAYSARLAAVFRALVDDGIGS